jgi:sugar O-acyltransferase (sialic acid O-acetyltransferase NeuD family)
VRLLIIGAGGHAKVVCDAAQAAGWDIAGVVDEHVTRTEVLGHLVSRSVAGIEADRFIVAIGDNRARARLFAEHVASGREPATIIHPSAVISPSAHIGAGTFVAAGAIVNPEAQVGDNVILNTGCVVEHDVTVGEHALIGPLAGLCGEAWVGSGVLLGAGVTVKPSARVGAWSTVGAGAAVVADLPPDSVCAGVPARVIRSTEES